MAVYRELVVVVVRVGGGGSLNPTSVSSPEKVRP